MFGLFKQLSMAIPVYKKLIKLIMMLTVFSILIISGIEIITMCLVLDIRKVDFNNMNILGNNDSANNHTFIE